MMERTDLTALSYEDWLAYIFAHECDPESPLLERTPWYLEDNFGARFGNPHVLVDYVGRMCLQFSSVAQRYSLPQLDHGIKFVLSAAGLWFREYLLAADLPLELRVGCIRNMEVVFTEFVARSTAAVMENCFYMWWDYLCPDGEDRNEDMRQIRQAMFESLLRILAVGEPRCQEAALHGLGHLGHSGSRRAIEEWLASHRDDLEPESLAWVEQCRDGRVM